MVFKTYGEVADVHVISGDSAAGSSCVAVLLSQHSTIVLAAMRWIKSRMVSGMIWDRLIYLYYDLQFDTLHVHFSDY